MLGSDKAKVDYGNHSSKNVNFRLPNYCSVFEAELIAFTENAEWLLGSLVPN